MTSQECEEVHLTLDHNPPIPDLYDVTLPPITPPLKLTHQENLEQQYNPGVIYPTLHEMALLTNGELIKFSTDVTVTYLENPAYTAHLLYKDYHRIIELEKSSYFPMAWFVVTYLSKWKIADWAFIVENHSNKKARETATHLLTKVRKYYKEEAYKFTSWILWVISG